MLLVAAIAISLSESFGGSLPSWQEIYTACGLHAEEKTPAWQNAAIQESATKIHFINVGQADATLIEQNGEFCLIDAGAAGSRDALLTYLDAAGVKMLKLLVMTHEHTDHIGSMANVLEHCEVQQVLLPDFTNAESPNGYTILRTLELIDLQGIPEVTAAPGQTFSIGDGTLTVLSSGIPTTEKNNTSIVVLFEAEGLRVLLCGDAEEAETSLLRENGTDVHAQLYKAAHHGASDANTQAWLGAIRPQTVIVSCGLDNSFGHPQPNALKAFESVGAQVYRTDQNGSIIAWVDAEGALQITPQRQLADESEGAQQERAAA